MLRSRTIFGCLTVTIAVAAGCNPGIISGENTGPGSGMTGSGGGTGSNPGSAGSGSSTGSGGSGSGGSGVTGAGGSTTTAASGLPCNIQAIFSSHCTACHGTVLSGGAPMSLVTRANLIALSTVDPTVTVAQRALVRVQATTGQMPPAPNPRLSSTEIQDLSTWVTSGYPAGTCSTSATGTGGTPGTTGAGGTAGGTGAGGAGGSSTAGGLPCDVQTVFQAHCTTCHSSPPSGGAPMSLVSYANLTAPSAVSAAMTYAQRAVTRMQDNTSPMPPVPGTRATAAEIQTVSSWISAGYPMGTCGGSTGTGGTGGTPDPLTRQPICTSNTFWTGGNSGNVLMNPGRACISCHTSSNAGEGEAEAPIFNIAGTLYPTGHEPDLCNGVNGTTGARVVVVDAANRTLTLTPNAAGNFTYTGALTTPYHAKVTYQGRERIMTAAQTSGDCNGCHTQNGANSAPGRITLP